MMNTFHKKLERAKSVTFGYVAHTPFALKPYLADIGGMQAGYRLFVYPTGNQENQNSQSYSCWKNESYLIKNIEKV